jgi:hypothetical protein
LEGWLKLNQPGSCERETWRGRGEKRNGESRDGFVAKGHFVPRKKENFKLDERESE